MRIFKRLIFFLALMVTMLFVVSEAKAQPPGPPGGGGGNPPCWPPPCIPIDGGIGFLIAAGAAYGAKKSLDMKKNS